MVYILFWLLVMVAAIVLEFFTMGLISIWFALGALVSLISAIFGAPFAVQVILFCLISIAMIFITKPIADKSFNGRRIRTNAESLIGKVVVATSEINNREGGGDVEIDGLRWSAKTVLDNVIIKEDSDVIIRGISGAHVLVEEVQVNKVKETGL